MQPSEMAMVMKTCFTWFEFFYGNWVESLGEGSHIEDDGKMLIIKGSLGESNEQEEN